MRPGASMGAATGHPGPAVPSAPDCACQQQRQALSYRHNRIRLWKEHIRDVVMDICGALHNMRWRSTPGPPWLYRAKLTQNERSFCACPHPSLFVPCLSAAFRTGKASMRQVSCRCPCPGATSGRPHAPPQASMSPQRQRHIRRPRAARERPLACASYPGVSRPSVRSKACVAPGAGVCLPSHGVSTTLMQPSCLSRKVL